MSQPISTVVHHIKVLDDVIFDTRIIDQLDLNIFSPSYWDQRGASQVAGGRGKVLFIQDGSRHWVLRHYRRGGLIGKVIADRYWWSGAERTRAFREWRLLAQLREQGLPVPQPVAARYQRKGLTYQADLITVAIPQARTLTQRLETEVLSEAVWQQLGEVLARFHAAGIQHADLNAHNIVFDAQQAIYILDFDRGQMREVQHAWIEVVMQRLLRSLNKLKKQRNIHFESQNWMTLCQAHDAVLQSMIQR
jgi:3-deoxy-D-manno-octulosonic acid kinase